MTGRAAIARAIAAMFRPSPARLFGPWRQPTTEAISRGPIGAPCFVCGEAIGEDDLGEFLETRTGALVPFQAECLVLVYLGHDVEVCECNNYAGCMNSDGTPRVRQAALLAGERLKAALATGVRPRRRSPREEPS